MARVMTLPPARRPAQVRARRSGVVDSKASPAAHRYLPALDGLRAIAVAAVIAYHLALPWARGGYLGVDLFFVLSGFLITGLLVGERLQAGRIDLGRFYSRRARRLLPALFLVLTVTSVWVGLGNSGVDPLRFRGDVLAALGYVANWRFVLSHQGYFDQFTTPSPIRHMWSLAIEEQFYLLWPLLLLGLAALGRGSRRVLIFATFILALLSALAMARVFRPGADPSRVYYGTDTRAFELLIGALVALAVTGRRQPGAAARRCLHVAGALGLAVFLVMVATVSDSSAWMYRGGFVLASVLAAAAIWSVSRDRPGLLGTALGFGPLRWIGQVSYGIYLWHWPVIVLLSRSATGLSGNGLRLAQVALTLAAATTSFYLLERPIRAGRMLSRHLRLAAPAAVATAVATVLWATVAPVSADGGLPTSGHRVAAVLPASPPTGPVGDVVAGTGPVGPVPAAFLGTSVPTRQAPLRVLVVGDSVMWDGSPGIKAALEATGVARVDLQAVLGFGLTRTAYDWRSAWPKLIAVDRPDLVIGMFGGWDGSPEAANGANWYGDLIEQSVAILTAGGAHLLWLEYPRNQPPDVAGKPPVDQVANERLRESLNAVLAASSLQHAGMVGYLPVGGALDQVGQFTAFLPASDGTLERVRKSDNIHFCPAGAERLGAWVLAALTPAFHLPPADPQWTVGGWRTDHRYDTPRGACA